MIRARITSKGQITLPVALRLKYGLQAGDDVEFVMEESHARLLPAKRRTLGELSGIFWKKGRPPIRKKEARTAMIDHLVKDDARIRRGGG